MQIYIGQLSPFSLSRLVLPFERHRRGEEDKPLPPSKPRKQYKRSNESKSSKAESRKRRRTSERDDLEVIQSLESVREHSLMLLRMVILNALEVKLELEFIYGCNICIIS